MTKRDNEKDLFRENWYEDGIMKRVGVRLSGLNGTWCLIDKYYYGHGHVYYLWESEELGDEVPAVLTDDKLNVLDADCYSGIYVALQDNGLLF